MEVRIRIPIATLVLLATLALPAVGAAASKVPPGVSGANQYTETLPGPGGNTRAGDDGSGKTPAQAVGKRNAAKLEALGAEGRAAAQLAAETAPAGNAGGGQGGTVQGGGAQGQASGGSGSNASGSSRLDQVLSQVTGTGGSDSGGMGLLLPLLIAAALLMAAVYAFNRRRTARPQD